MVTTRVLPFDEWDKLIGTEAEGVYKDLNPESTKIVVAERDGEVIGCQVLTWALHAECLWVDPALRGKASVIKRLWPAIKDTVKSMGADGFLTAAIDDNVKDVIYHLGGMRVPGDTYVIPIAD